MSCPFPVVRREEDVAVSIRKNDYYRLDAFSRVGSQTHVCFDKLINGG